MRMLRFLGLAVFVVCIAAFASGCGGGGGGSAMAPDPDPPAMPDPTPQEMCEADGGRYNADGSCTSAADLAEEMALSGAQEAAMAAYMAAMAAVNGAKDPVAMGKAQMYADMAKEASDAAAMAGTSAMAMEYQMKAEMNRDMAMEAAMKRGLGITTLANKITNQDAIDNAVLEGREPPRPVSNAGRVGAELAATAGQTSARELGRFVGDDGAGNVSQGEDTGARVTYGANGPTFRVLDAGNLGIGETPALLTTRGGWLGREMLAKSTVEVYANVYTDIQAPMMRQNYGDTTTGDAATGTNAAILAVDQIITGDIPGDGSTFMATRNVSATDNLPTQSGRVFCPADTACAISVDEDGKIVAVQGYGWQPIASGTTPSNDADYLAWGFWLVVPVAAPSADAATNARVAAFASGNDVFEVRAALTGTATYNGVATGLYAAGGMVEYFDADVSLMANFGGTDGADSTPGSAPAATDNDGLLLGAVTGSVSNIKAGGMDVAGSLTLKKANVLSGVPGTPSTTPNDPSTAGFQAAAEGSVGGQLLMGNWSGQFFGLNKAAADSMAARTEYPTTAAGTFAVTGGGHTPMSLLGSFGAWKAE